MGICSFTSIYFVVFTCYWICEWYQIFIACYSIQFTFLGSPSHLFHQSSMLKRILNISLYVSAKVKLASKQPCTDISQLLFESRERELAVQQATHPLKGGCSFQPLSGIRGPITEMKQTFFFIWKQGFSTPAI